MSESTPVRVALAGNPNSGKTSLFNALTGAHQKVANYPGVTVEKREGSYRFEERRFDVLDLPGTYSLTSYSPEERIAQRELTEGQPDVTVVVVDSTNLKRSLMLLGQVMQLGANPVLCLNMWDEAERAGLELDVEQMASLLGFPVLPTAAHRAVGIGGLKSAIAKAALAPADLEGRLVLGERLQGALDQIRGALTGTPHDSPVGGWIAQKLLVREEMYVEAVRRGAGETGERAIAVADDLRSKLETETGLDIVLFVTERYYGFVDGLLREVLRRPTRSDARASSDRIDAVLVHRLFGLPIFFGTMYGLFWLTFTLGAYPMEWIEAGQGALAGSVSSLWAEGSESALRSLLVDGIIGGVGGVLVFLPNIVLLFFGLAFLEDTGYMARAAFLMDRMLHRFGLHGQSFIPLMTGFGCSIPGIMATRALANERDRLITMMVLPLMSCGARLPIYMLLIPAFFAPPWHAPMLWLIYAIGVSMALVLALLLRKTVLHGEEAPFVLELPPYRVPTGRALLRTMTDRSWVYIRKAGTIILGISVVMWAASSYPKKSTFEVDEAIAAGRIAVVETKGPASPAEARAAAAEGVEVLTAEEVEMRRGAEQLRGSVAGHVGGALEIVVSPMGFDWRIGTALIGAFAAKEVFVAQMGIVYALGEADEGSEGLRRALRRDYTPLVGFCLMLFLLIATPCMATLAVIRRESGSWKWALVQFAGLTVIAFVLTTVVYQIGRLLG